MKQPTPSHGLGQRVVTRQGFALPTLLIMLSLASLATLLAWRNLWVNEQLLNAQADQLRTQHKAEAVLPLALADIVGLPSLSSLSTSPTPNLRHTAGSASQNHAFFPANQAEYDMLRQRLTALASPCSAGICAPQTLDPLTAQASYWRAQTAHAMPVSFVDAANSEQTAWYWVEVFVHPASNAANTAAAAPFVYRVTAFAKGVMPSSSTVLQAIWRPPTPPALTGQWQSWHVLRQ